LICKEMVGRSDHLCSALVVGNGAYGKRRGKRKRITQTGIFIVHIESH